MIRKRIIVMVLSLGTVIASTFLLITASPLLTWPLDKSDRVPLGTFITWFGLIALQTFLYYSKADLNKPKSWHAQLFSSIMKGFIWLSIAWLPICFLLAGNLSFSFSEKATFQGGQSAMQLFWYFNYFLVLAPLVLFIVFKIFSFLDHLRKNG